MLIKFYGAEWCGDCARSKFVLQGLGVQYEYIDIDQDEKAAMYVEEVNNGFKSIPTIVFPDGTILTEPSANELEKAVKSM